MKMAPPIVLNPSSSVWPIWAPIAIVVALSACAPGGPYSVGPPPVRGQPGYAPAYPAYDAVMTPMTEREQDNFVNSYRSMSPQERAAFMQWLWQPTYPAYGAY